MNKKILYLIGFFLIPGWSAAQTVIASGGTANYTVGEAVIHTFADQTSYQTAGFHQGDPMTTGTTVLNGLSVHYEIFPNPTSGIVSIVADDILLRKIGGYFLINGLGQRQFVSVVSDPGHLDLSSLVRGVYRLLAVSDQNEIILTHSIIIQ